MTTDDGGAPNGAAPIAWSLPGGVIERPCHTPNAGELWVYASEMSYARADSVSLFVHTTCDTFDVEIIRDGLQPKTVWTAKGLPGHVQNTPTDCYTQGCQWQESLRIDLNGTAWESGFYLIVATGIHDGRPMEAVGFFVLRPSVAADHDFVLIHTTSTMLAYNDWGGANHYRGVPDGMSDTPAYVVSSQRPVARGMLRKPASAPRNANPETPGPGWIPRYPVYEWAWHHRYSRHHADAGWATYERPFTVWAEQQGYRVGHITQHDLHRDPNVLDGYRCAVIVGHDEYWSWEMRDHIDGFIDKGGRLARFAGNYLWQVRLDLDEHTQTCFKDPRLDPVRGPRVTTSWDAPEVGRPGAQTMGLTGFPGVYSRFGAASPRSSGGFTVYRPDHWVLAGTDLYYGDVFGGPPSCVGAFEMDGVDYTFSKGLPYPTGADGAPADLEIIAMALGVTGSRDRWNGTVPICEPIDDVDGDIEAIFEGDPPEYLREIEYSAGMIATFERGNGSVFCAGTTEWVNGLIHRDPFTHIITRNVLDAFVAPETREGDR
ncbi:hypothetical protein [Mycobacterium sp. OAE908]|uniref:N,N-dimethylformamidase beta subunit family domain-containing protein n=1 Tax=Mycobacterium sp. OAE908 TaxID=2817899 RepID=UPI001AEB039A